MKPLELVDLNPELYNDALSFYLIGRKSTPILIVKLQKKFQGGVGRRLWREEQVPQCDEVRPQRAGHENLRGCEREPILHKLEDRLQNGNIGKEFLHTIQ